MKTLQKIVYKQKNIWSKIKFVGIQCHILFYFILIYCHFSSFFSDIIKFFLLLAKICKVWLRFVMKTITLLRKTAVVTLWAESHHMIFFA
jgi:hypothetical protein